MYQSRVAISTDPAVVTGILIPTASVVTLTLATRGPPVDPPISPHSYVPPLATGGLDALVSGPSFHNLAPPLTPSPLLPTRVVFRTTCVHFFFAATSLAFFILIICVTVVTFIIITCTTLITVIIAAAVFFIDSLIVISLFVVVIAHSTAVDPFFLFG